MKESVGYTVSLNIMIVFITIVVAFLCAALIYFKSNKVSNIITTSIEKYEGFNTTSINEITMNLKSIGYGSHAISCGNGTVADKGAKGGTCNLVQQNNAKGELGFCVFYCVDAKDDQYYYYKIKSNMMISIPIIHDILDIPIYSNTNRMYKF